MPPRAAAVKRGATLELGRQVAGLSLRCEGAGLRQQLGALNVEAPAMPWTNKQVRLFYAIKAGKAKQQGLSRKRAASLLREDPRGTRPAVEVVRR